MNKHLYECRYAGQNKAMFIRLVRDGSLLNEFKTYEDRYMYIRAIMDLWGVDFALKLAVQMDKKNKDLVWLAWGHKSGLIRSVGLGDYTWRKVK